MGKPSALSNKARYRMQRTLSLAGLYGKPIMRMAVRVAAKYAHDGYPYKANQPVMVGAYADDERMAAAATHQPPDRK